MKTKIIIKSLAPPVNDLICARPGRWEVRGSILGRACQPSFSEFSMVFSETRVNGLGSLRKTPMKGNPPIGPGPTYGQLALSLQPTN